MKSIAQTNRLIDRIVDLFDKLFIRHNGSEKFRIMTKEKSMQVNKQQSLKISQSHW